jgi:hypothetical protein
VQAHPYSELPSKNIGFTIRPVGGRPASSRPPATVCTQQSIGAAPELDPPGVGAALGERACLAAKQGAGVFYNRVRGLASNATTFNPPVDVGDDNWSPTAI